MHERNRDCRAPLRVLHLAARLTSARVLKLSRFFESSRRSTGGTITADDMPDDRPIDVEPSPAATEPETVVPYARFREWQRRRATPPGAPVDPPPGNEAAVVPVPRATPTHDR
jgi:hypothetical protein